MSRRTLLPAFPASPAVLRAEVEAAARYADASKAPNTRRAYAADWRAWTAWCAGRAISPLPADPRAVATFLAAGAEAGLLPPTVRRRLAAIAHHHREAGHVAPHRVESGAVVSAVLAGIVRSRVAPRRRADAADADLLAAMLEATPPDSLRALRDRALLAIGMGAALRRAELVALTLADIERRREGIIVTVRRSKTDQEGAGDTIAVPHGSRLRPVAMLDAWLEEAGIEEGPVFRSLHRSGRVLPHAMCDRGVARIVAAAAARAGLAGRFSGHSLRAGFITSAARDGQSIFGIQRTSRHRSLQVLAGYVRVGHAFRDHAGDRFL